ncbi:MAG: hypothetical protein GX111_01430 [Clostridiales bacterium]|nr:hypothetical protein [Clostridiales bacterium]
MIYPRPPYLSPDIKTEKSKIMFSNTEVSTPKIDTPITPLENFRRMAMRDHPLWMPNALTDMQTLMIQDIADGAQIGPDFKRRATEDYQFYDWFGVSWTWVCSAGGAVTTPGINLLDDITDWESVIKFPVLGEWDWKTKADDFLKNQYDPNRVLHIDLGPGCVQRLISVLGGYSEGMLAFATEPDAVKAFFSRFADFMIEVVDLLYAFYPVTMLTIHDDWGTERDTFFSPKMMEELLFEPTKRIVSHVKAKGGIYMQHTCGNVARFIPYMIDMGTDLLQIQRRAVNIPEMKEKYGDKIGFNVGIEGVSMGKPASVEEMCQKIRNTVDIYGKGGGAYVNLFDMDPEKLWIYLFELYCYSREFYDKEM